jgi:hypothetical protein
MDDMDARKAENLARTKWNEEADEFNQWSELGQDEKDKLIDAMFCDKSKCNNLNIRCINCIRADVQLRDWYSE